jgi:predicted molibdopterin-dependent oxidoreductase YjgC
MPQNRPFGADLWRSPEPDFTPTEDNPAVRIEGLVKRPTPVTITVDGRPISAFAGESLAAALFAAGIRTLRRSPRAATPRGMFCLMGVCQECLVRLDGRRVTACEEPVREGMAITTGAES